MPYFRRTVHSLIIFIKQHFLVSLVLFGGIFPLVSRFNCFPLTTYPMFSDKISPKQVWAYQIFVASPAGDSQQIPMFSTKVLYALMSKSLESENGDLTLGIINASRIALLREKPIDIQSARISVFGARFANGIPQKEAIERKLLFTSGKKN